MKLYLVSDGTYSDYAVIGIYSTLELAERARLLFATDNSIEDYELDDIPETPPGLLPYLVRMDRNGNTTDDPCRVSVGGGELSEPKPVSISYGDAYSFEVWADSIEHAVKIANEKRLQLIATNQWLTYDEYWKVHLRAKP